MWFLTIRAFGVIALTAATPTQPLPSLPRLHDLIPGVSQAPSLDASAILCYTCGFSVPVPFTAVISYFPWQRSPWQNKKKKPLK